MEIMPSEYSGIELNRYEKIFARNVLANEGYGYLLLATNPAMIQKERMHTLICSKGILFLKFFEEFDDSSRFGDVMPSVIASLYKNTKKIIVSKLRSNKALVDESDNLKFPVNILYVFPIIKREEVREAGDDDLRGFTKKHCLFAEELQRVRADLAALEEEMLAHPVSRVAQEVLSISNENINSILQRIAPEYVTIRMADVKDTETKAGADNELLVVTEDDRAVRAFRLDTEQINMVNKISKGDQLILACAGSGKSVLLIAKCFKAASMNPDKSFLITCYNKNLQTLYSWLIDRAGLRAKNVKCYTFHVLCKKLLSNNGCPVGHENYDEWVRMAIQRLNTGRIKERYYGIFIDEVQQFDSEWYKFCYNLLENKDSGDHLFVICGDKTQKLANLQRHGRAPWNAGEGYPNYRGKSIRIEKNYRNCIEINEFINRYIHNAKDYLFSISKEMALDPDEFLRGKSVFHGQGVSIKHLTDCTNNGESKAIVESIREIHDIDKIPYDEIAVIMYNTKYKKQLSGWKSKSYRLERPLIVSLDQEGIPYCIMSKTEESWESRYGENGGVRLITFQSTLGLDFRAAIVCGILPLGVYDKSKNPNWDQLKEDEEKYNEMVEKTANNIRLLYVACTRAKEVLHVILPETQKTSVYVKMLEEAE